jgi:hypothetical protein
METPEERAQRILKEDAFRIAYEQSNVALYIAGSMLASNVSCDTLTTFVNALNRQSKLYVEYDKLSDNIQLRIRAVYRLEKELVREGVSIDFLTSCKKALIIAQKLAVIACHEFGNIEPFFKPLFELNADQDSLSLNPNVLL